MAIIDSLLALQRSQHASALLLSSEQVPVLEIGGEHRSLSMPPLDDTTVRGLLDELGAGDVSEDLAADGSVDLAYEPPEGPRYSVRVTSSARGFSMTFRPELDPSAQAHAKPAAAPNASEVSRTPKRRAETSPLPDPTAPIAALLIHAMDMHFEDVILSTSSPTRGRIDGRIQLLGDTPVTAEQVDALIRRAADPARDETLRTSGTTDFALSVDADGRLLRFRVNVFRHQEGTTAVLRPIRTRIPALRELGLPDDFTSLVSHPHGLVLLTGPAGSGKSTTLASLVEHVNQTRTAHVITLEDPIEYLYAPSQCLIHQREVGRHVESFSSGLRAALRESPDIIVVGELRDRAVMSAALIAAETGHLVLATLHAGNTTMAVERLIGAFEPHDQPQVRMQLAAVLRGVVAQVLLPLSAGQGRVAAYEKLVVNHAAATKIREDRCHQLLTVLQSGRGEGMVLFETTLADLVARGSIRAETALAASQDPETLRRLMR